MSHPIVELKDVGKSFSRADGTPRAVLEHVDFVLREGEIVALLGQSGSGKSTMLRIMAGLVQADAGAVTYRGQPLFGPARGVSMVFQSFALFPWLTVQQNVELGLEAQGVSQEERAQRAEEAIKLIGLSGFEGALPRELSGGMRQRVGIARALVVQPEVLLMDEAFSALDVLTGENLREEILELWDGGKMPTKAILVVSHNIEEAVMMADRIMIFGSNPGRVRFQMQVGLPRPRRADSREVRALIDEVYALMTAGAARSERGVDEPVRLRLTDSLPVVDVNRMEAVLEMLQDGPFHGRADLPKLAEESDLTDEDMLKVASALALLDLAQIHNGDLSITGLGGRYVEADHFQRKLLFGRQLLARVPLVAHIRHSLEQEASGELPEKPFLRLLSDAMDPQEAEEVLRVVVEWGRYGEVLEYDLHTRRIHLPGS
ncbi:MAG TPA: nitrate/sulfonate/bicarbonate ABC transporter ATP-binding protein [Aquabacterium sp.]|nr:nitrate/sulfonate/bicarbonate ABC transporter ATP-binding protein [Aquabacterium sp.]